MARQKKKQPRRKIAKTFCYQFTKETLDRFKGMSAGMKLEWLEEANEFVNKFVSPAKRKYWEKIKLGKIMINT